MANETMVTIPLEEYKDLRKKAEENLYLATQLGQMDNRMWEFDNRLREFDERLRRWELKN